MEQEQLNPQETTNPQPTDQPPSDSPSSVQKDSQPSSDASPEPDSKSFPTGITKQSEKHVLGHGGPAALFRGRSSLYTGNTQVGKTCKAVDDLFSLTQQTKDPFLIIDTIGARNFKPYEQFRTRTLTDTIKRVYGERRHAIWIPADIEDEVNAICEVIKTAADSGRRATLFIDEISQIATAWRWSKEVGLLFRAHSHCNLSIFTTSQYAGDLPPVALNCCENSFCFQTTSPRAIKKMQETFGFDPDTMRNLVVGEYLQNSR